MLETVGTGDPPRQGAGPETEARSEGWCVLMLSSIGLGFGRSYQHGIVVRGALEQLPQDPDLTMFGLFAARRHHDEPFRHVPAVRKVHDE